jgi:hypothetical protein
MPVHANGQSTEGLMLGMNTSTLFRYYPLRETNGTAVEDLSDNRVNSTYTNTPTLGGDGIGPRILGGSRAASFNGTNEYVTGDGAVWWDSTGAMSAAVWTFFNGFSGTSTFPAIVNLKTDQATRLFIGISNQADYNGVLVGSNANFLVRETPTSCPGNDFIGVWRHVVVTFDGVDRTAGSSYKIYVDGSLCAHEAAGVFSAATNTNRIAADASGANLYWSGKLQHFTIWQGSELTAAQVESLYLVGINGG